MIKDYIILEQLGQGSYGTVYKVKKKNTNDIYALKQMSYNDLSKDEINQIKKEAKILNLINSDFVIKIYDSFEEKNNMNIVMEYCDGGDLDDFIKEKKKKGNLLEENLIWKIFIKITIGLADIHKLNILHRDLKTLNIFLKKGLDMDIKIGDLGVAKVISNNALAKTMIGTPYYLSPEICEEKPYNDKSDVWALGCILYELCTFKHPFEAKSQGALIVKILNKDPDHINRRYSNDLKKLTTLLLDKDSEKRLSCLEILKSNMVIDKVKNFGLYEYIEKLDKSETNSNRTNNNNIKINEKIIDINITNRNNSNIKDNTFNKGNSGRPIIKNVNNKKQVSAIDINDDIKINNLKYNNINKQKISKRGDSEAKVNIITIDSVKNQRTQTSNNNIKNNNQNIKYNNYFKIEDNKNITKEKGIISQNISKELTKNKSDAMKKIINYKETKIIKNPGEVSPRKPNNYFEYRKMININNNNKDDLKKKDNDIQLKYAISEKKKRYNEIPVPIKTNQIRAKYLRFNDTNENSNAISNNRKDINQNINNDNKRIIFHKNDNKLNIISNTNQNKRNLIEFLPRNNKANNENKRKKIDSYSFYNNRSQRNLLTNFKIINNTQEINNSKKKIGNELEDSIVKNIKDKNEINITKNNKDSDYGEERVKIIREITDGGKKIKTNIITFKKDEGTKLLKEKIQKVKDDLLKIIGEKDYEYIMNQYNIFSKQRGANYDIYEKIENYANNNFTGTKKDNFFQKYLSMIKYDCQLGRKIGH
jgi:NIMA (never in mitosis gene a)-related kinase